ncbi:MAG TPA: cytochrome P450 [Chloroflexota bacterium]|nr:cytochrome P450 [Chloroflexota bacterium]
MLVLVMVQAAIARPGTAGFLADPYPYYAWLRERDPVQFDVRTRRWVISRYTDVARLLGEEWLGKRALTEAGFARLPWLLQPFARARFQHSSASLLVQDPPDHTRLRTLMSKAFSARAVQALEGDIERMASELLDRLAPGGGMDVMADFAAPLPVAVISRMLGVPAEHMPRLHAWSGDLAAQLQTEPSFSAIRRAASAAQAFINYLGPIIQARREQPRDDILSGLIQAEEAGDRLTTPELYANVITLLVAGHETTTNLIGNGVLALSRHPDQAELLRQEPGLLPNAVEELLRFDSPAQRVRRVTLTEMEVGGRAIPAGQFVTLELGSANRDPAHFAQPEALDVRREEQRHVAFGHGPHFCLGAALARLEGRIAFGQLMERFPGMRLAADRLEWRRNDTLRGLRSLPVRF